MTSENTPTSKNKFIQLGLTTSGTAGNIRIHVESLPPMTPDEFASWLFNATRDPRDEEEERRQKNRLLSRKVVPTWVAERASEEEIRQMARRREIWNKVKAEHPLWSKLEIDIEAKRRMQAGEEKRAKIDAWEKKFASVMDELLAID